MFLVSKGSWTLSSSPTFSAIWSISDLCQSIDLYLHCLYAELQSVLLLSDHIDPVTQPVSAVTLIPACQTDGEEPTVTHSITLLLRGIDVNMSWSSLCQCIWPAGWHQASITVPVSPSLYLTGCLVPQGPPILPCLLWMVALVLGGVREQLIIGLPVCHPVTLTGLPTRSGYSYQHK